MKMNRTVIAIASVVLVFAGLFYLVWAKRTDHSQGQHIPQAVEIPTEIPAPVKTEPAVDPEIKMLTKYQKDINTNVPIEIAELQAKIMLEVAKDDSVPIELIVGIAGAESNFNALATSSAGAAGLMQILQAPNVEIDPVQKYDLTYNLKTACKILKGKLAANGNNLSQALTAYSGGAKWYVDKIYDGFVKYRVYRTGAVAEMRAGEPDQPEKIIQATKQKKILVTAGDGTH